jgi:hypothetical protein
MIKLKKERNATDSSVLFLMVNENPRNRNLNTYATEIQKLVLGPEHFVKLSPIMGNAVLVRTVEDTFMNQHGLLEKRETHGFTQEDKDFLYFSFAF